MMSSPIQSRRATLWLCLVLALCIAVLPASGLMLCLGHDGHLGVGTGAAQTTGCPCAHDDSATDTQTGPLLAFAQPAHDPDPGNTQEPSDDRHPCDDLDLDAPEAVRSAGLTQDLQTLLGKNISSWSAHFHELSLVPANLASLRIEPGIDPGSHWGRSRGAGPASSRLAILPLQGLTHRRSIVLLI